MRTIFSKGDVKYAIKWGHLCSTACNICKKINECKGICKHQNPCKLYVMNAEGGEVKLKTVNKNALPPTRGIAGAAGYDLAAAEAAVMLAHGKCLVKIGLAMALPPSCYGRIAPRSGLALKRFIDVGAGVIDSDYRGEVGVILFNFEIQIVLLTWGTRFPNLFLKRLMFL